MLKYLLSYRLQLLLTNPIAHNKIRLEYLV